MRFHPQKTLSKITILSTLSFLLAGCAFMQLSQETQILQNSTVLVGTVSSTLPLRDMPVVVAAYLKKGNTRTIVHYTQLHELGPYELIVPKGNYHIVAFVDENRNLIYEKGEAVGQYVEENRVFAPAGGVVGDLNLQIQYKFKELYITAHSMGGLVVRSFIVNFGNLFPSITNFISISTPWGGEELAKSGVKYSPAVIPAWRDIQPESEFIKSIYHKSMPATIEHFLFFGHKGNRNLLRPNNDRVVTLASQLDQRSQREAKMI
jgi:hypothetical protein